MATWFFGVLGVISTYWVGTRYFGFSQQDVILCIVGAMIAGFLSLLSTLALERQAVLKKHVMNRTLKTWVVLAILYSSLLVVIAPALREPRTFVLMFIPVVMCTGLMIPVFGPVQDRVYRRIQRRMQL